MFLNIAFMRYDICDRKVNIPKRKIGTAKDIFGRQNCYHSYYYCYYYEVNIFFTTAIKPMKCNIDKKNQNYFDASSSFEKPNFVISTKIMTTRKMKKRKNNVSTYDHVVNIFYDFINSLLYSINFTRFMVN